MKGERFKLKNDIKDSIGRTRAKAGLVVIATTYEDAERRVDVQLTDFRTGTPTPRYIKKISVDELEEIKGGAEEIPPGGWR